MVIPLATSPVMFPDRYRPDLIGTVVYHLEIMFPFHLSPAFISNVLRTLLNSASLFVFFIQSQQSKQHHFPLYSLNVPPSANFLPQTQQREHSGSALAMTLLLSMFCFISLLRL